MCAAYALYSGAGQIAEIFAVMLCLHLGQFFCACDRPVFKLLSPIVLWKAGSARAVSNWIVLQCSHDNVFPQPMTAFPVLLVLVCAQIPHCC